MTCPNENTLAALIEGTLDAASQATLLDHADTCSDCSALLAELGIMLKPDPSAQPRIVSRYTILHKVGEGAMGIVYAAYDPNLDRNIALKLLRTAKENPAEQTAAEERLLREARLLASLSHPNVMTVHDAGRWEDTLFMAVELIDGTTLTDWLRSDHPTWRAITQAFLQAARGLAAAHKAGLVHRDVKPDNILITTNPDDPNDVRVLLTDFGLAKSELDEEEVDALGSTAEGATLLTRTGALMGTPLYMAPELFSGVSADTLSDQYALSASLFEALYRSQPYPGRTLAEILRRSREHDVAPLSDPNVSPRLHAALIRALHPNPDQRFASIDAFMHELEASLDPSRLRVTGRTFAAVAAVALVGVAGFIAMLALAPEPAPPYQLNVFNNMAHLGELQGSRAHAMALLENNEGDACLKELDRLEQIDVGNLLTGLDYSRALCDMMIGECERGKVLLTQYYTSLGSRGVETLVQLAQKRHCPAKLNTLAERFEYIGEQTQMALRNNTPKRCQELASMLLDEVDGAGLPHDPALKSQGFQSLLMLRQCLTTHNLCTQALRLERLRNTWQPSEVDADIQRFYTVVSLTSNPVCAKAFEKDDEQLVFRVFVAARPDQDCVTHLPAIRESLLDTTQLPKAWSDLLGRALMPVAMCALRKEQCDDGRALLGLSQHMVHGDTLTNAKKEEVVAALVQSSGYCGVTQH